MTQGQDEDPTAANGDWSGDGETVTPEELKRRIDAGKPVSVLDVRNRDELEVWRIEGVDLTNIPYMKIIAAKARGGADKLVTEIAEPMVIVCPHGEASDEVAETLREAGVEAYNLADGMRGWARVFKVSEVDVDARGATVRQYQRPATGCLSYLVAAGGEALVVDPLRAFADHYIADAQERGLDVQYVMDTHIHADHLSGLRDVARRAGAEPVASEASVARGVTYDVATVADGDELPLGGLPVKVVATPGHTSGGVSLLVGDLLLTGDTLFVEAVPRPDLEAGEDGIREAARELHRTLTERLARFDDDTLVGPSHYSSKAKPADDGTYTARLGDVREHLPAFSRSRKAFVKSILGGLGPRPANFKEIIAINLGRQTIDEAEAFELELGPNNCTATPAD